MAHFPYLEVTRGNPTPEELAALVAVLAWLEDADDTVPETPRSAWSDGARTARRPLPSGRDAWRTSGWVS
ncbi:hypothetical protein GCM10009677_23580 [Sphaerisporangium rubeum]|uniref:Acyl-CoA carboxylase subunit epsilon n=1 Tax=Sphaerisporangium rubeum TaxID=321317 RepID=A0A7X0M5W6_9ACTN|nr:hypothetical protein [Sphaerisporangium rubeum]